jgi:hypothetical protein
MKSEKPWSEEELVKLCTLRDEKRLTWSEVGATLGRTLESCRLKYSRSKGRVIFHQGPVGPTGACSPPREQAVSSEQTLGPTGCEGGPGSVGVSSEPAKKGPAVKHSFDLPKPEFGRLPLEILDSGGWQRFGLVSDTHLCCKEERLDALHAQYDLFACEGITTVFHGGNLVDGYVARINGDSVFETTIDGQAQYAIDNYPQRPNITTHFITGDDHESWFAPGFNFGAYLDMLSKAQGRNDLNYIGHCEADIELRSGPHVQIIKVMHPGGGSAYARSYKGQKIVESFQGGEKPAILLIGHYHVSGYTFDRNVHVIGMPGFQDQTVFGRKKQLRFEVGGCLMEFKMSAITGSITRFRPEFSMFFDRGFYKPFLKSDARILKGHLKIDIE